MRLFAALFLAAGAFASAAFPALGREICSLVIDARTAQTLHESGDCTTPVTPASTFKIPLALIGFDSGLLAGPQTPKLAFQPGDPDWGDRWKEDTDPVHWMKYSVLWYSQRITHTLGTQTMSDYVAAFDYGNGDLSGDAGFDNGLERAWISSSLLISPRGQADFILRLLARDLPVSESAYDNTLAIIQTFPTDDGWMLYGKTGGAYPRNADRSFDYSSGWGWFIGWAERGDQTAIFVRLDQDDTRMAGSPGQRARAALIAGWADLIRAWP